MPLLLICAISGCGTEKKATAEIPGIHRETFLYAVKEENELFLDRLIDSSTVGKDPKPVFIYSHSGAWEAGQRNESESTPFLEFIARKGYVVAAIDYRLGIKEIRKKNRLNEGNMSESYLAALDMAVDDLLSATAYILNQADSWNIDPKMVVLGGFGSGAANSLKAEYEACGTNLSLKFLPEGFNYAGVVSMSGALWLSDQSSLPVWSGRPCPHLFIHGSSDHVMPYNETRCAGFSSYGPAYLYRRLSELDHPVWFYDIQGGNHLSPSLENSDYYEQIDLFLKHFVREKRHKIIHTIEEQQCNGDLAP